MSTERGGTNSRLKSRAEHFARHLHSRLRSLSETDDAGWSSAGEQVSLSPSSDNEVFYDIDSSLASPQEEAMEPQFINHNHSDTLSDNSVEYMGTDITSAPSSNGIIRRNSSDIQFYDISEMEDLNSCMQVARKQMSEQCAECCRKEMININKESKDLAEKHVKRIETEQNNDNVEHHEETNTVSLCDKCVKIVEGCGISYPKYSKVWREDNLSMEECAGILTNSKKWNDSDLTRVDDDCKLNNSVPEGSDHCDRNHQIPDRDEKHSHNGEGESDKTEYHKESEKVLTKEVDHNQNGLTQENCDQCIPNGPLESEETLRTAHIDARKVAHEEKNTKDVQQEILICETGSYNSNSNDRLDGSADSDNNLSLSELLNVLKKEYTDRGGSSAILPQNSETKVDSSSVSSNVAKTAENETISKEKVKVEDEEEDIEVRRLRFRRCSSLKSGKTPPGTPGRKKIVRFADVLGLDLADVKTFLDEIPTIPKSAYQDLHDIELSSSPVESTFRILSQPQKSERTLLPLFQQPCGQPFFLDRVRNNNVCLENAIVSDPVLFAITGTVRVKNIDFHKSVHIRYTIDNWKSYADLQARYVPNSCDGFSDKFSFLLYAHTLDVGNRLEFAVRFQAKGEQYWDNNGGTNYVFQCVSQDPTSSMPRVQASSYLPQSPVDTWPSFY